MVYREIMDALRIWRLSIYQMWTLIVIVLGQLIEALKGGGDIPRRIDL